MGMESEEKKIDEASVTWSLSTQKVRRQTIKFIDNKELATKRVSPLFRSCKYKVWENQIDTIRTQGDIKPLDKYFTFTIFGDNVRWTLWTQLPTSNIQL